MSKNEEIERRVDEIADILTEILPEKIQWILNRFVESKRKERAAVELIESIHHHVKPAPRVNGNEYFPREGVAEDVFQMIEKWRSEPKDKYESL